MISFVLGFMKAGWSLFKAVAADGLGLPVRPIQLAAVWDLVQPGTAAMFAGPDAAFLPTLIGAGCVMLIMISLDSITEKASIFKVPIYAAVSAVYLAEAAYQLPQLLLPFSAPAFAYTMPYTAVMFPFQCCVPVNLMALTLGIRINLPEWVEERGFFLYTAVALRYISARALPAASPPALLAYFAACATFAKAITPRALMECLCNILHAIVTKIFIPVVRRVSLLVSDVVEFVAKTVWPFVKRMLQAFQRYVWTPVVRFIADHVHPLLVQLYQQVIERLWSLLTPFLAPAAAAAVAVACAGGARVALQESPPTPSSLARGSALAYSALGAAASSAVLLLEATCRVLGASDPLRWSALTSGLLLLSRLAALPITLAERLLDGLMLLWPYIAPLLSFLGNVLEVVFTLLGNVWEALAKFAMDWPLMSIPCVVATAAGVIKVLKEHPISLSVGWAWRPVVRFLATAVPVEGPLFADGASDATFALALILLVQSGAFWMVRTRLKSVRQLRRAGTGSALSVEELNLLAEGMEDPRRCGGCWFGPVDHQGCSDLLAHHGQVTVAGSGRQGHVSNACPRCGWFVPNMSQWPRWDGSLFSPGGQALHRGRVWADLVLIVRATAKALVVPFAVLRGAIHLGLPPSLAGTLALSYLLPWTAHSAGMMEVIRAPCYVAPRDRAPRGGGRGGGGGDSCGAQRAPVVPAGHVSDQALREAVLQAAPSRVYITAGDICPVCLDDFPDKAADIAGSLSGEKAAEALRHLEPPVVGLRCGHPLHVPCAEAMIGGAQHQHMRCPLCREPITFVRAAAARAFG